MADIPEWAGNRSFQVPPEARHAELHRRWLDRDAMIDRMRAQLADDRQLATETLADAER